uniref:Uncharacterized protein n=1 Tax=viral metagenome TaxID=1070528 RepID=A0A6C0KDU3_9ZZZZ
MLLEFASWVDLHISTSLLLSMFGLLCVTILVAQYFALVYFAEQRVQGDCDTSRQCGAGFVCGFNREYNRKMCHRAGAVLCSAKPDDLRACTVGGTCPCANDTPFACKSVKYPTLEYSGAAPALDFQASHVPVANHTGCGSARGMVVSLTQSAVTVVNPGVGYQKNCILTAKADNTEVILKVTSVSGYPYGIISSGKNTAIPPTTGNHGWCLPEYDSANEVDCKTGNGGMSILREELSGKYTWGCQCLAPNMFTQVSDTTACVVAGDDLCSGPMKGRFFADTGRSCKLSTDCERGEVCTDDDKECQNGAACSCKTPDLSSQRVDRDTGFTQGFCVCRAGLSYVSRPSSVSDQLTFDKLCLPGDTCFPGKIDGQYCTCGKGLIASPHPVHALPHSRFNPSGELYCLVDPCAPHGQAVYKDDKWTCNCNPGYITKTYTDGTVNLISSTCFSPCGANICAEGTRSKPNACKIDKGAPVCTVCACPYCNKGTDKCYITSNDGKRVPYEGQMCDGQISGKSKLGQTCKHDSDCCPGARCDNSWNWWKGDRDQGYCTQK